MITSLVLKVKRRETPFYSAVYNIAKKVRRFSVPSIYVIHRPLYDLSRKLINLRWFIQQMFWSVPVFKTRCKKCGSGLRLPNGMPWIDGNPVIDIGDNVALSKCMISAGHVFDTPLLIIGNNTRIGYNTTISVNKYVQIGENVLIAFDCFIADSNGHPTDPIRRHGTLLPEEIVPVVIGNNVWIAKGASILKGVTVGENSIVSTNSVVIRDVPPNSVVAGNPAVVIKSLEVNRG